MTPAQERIISMLQKIDAALTYVVTRPERSTWTTPEIENLLLDIRIELQLYKDFVEFEQQVRAIADADK